MRRQRESEVKRRELRVWEGGEGQHGPKFAGTRGTPIARHANPIESGSCTPIMVPPVFGIYCIALSASLNSSNIADPSIDEAPLTMPIYSLSLACAAMSCITSSVQTADGILVAGTKRSLCLLSPSHAFVVCHTTIRPSFTPLP